ncbi:hypothetical protein [Hippea sp. KM1]|uniref:hypothetical protein n=1 Tax=Hippea sp. KM1 TaxID=944481 RepID=UPI00046D69D2|nr:hypothetical protein [Hippea sp. KM1]
MRRGIVLGSILMTIFATNPSIASFRSALSRPRIADVNKTTELAKVSRILNLEVKSDRKTIKVKNIAV